ncbi:MAG: ABC transporter ATP-binding protein [Alphaproteobacteria bacterium]|nr:ABC transporter ATP-binding protein [Alphaproteobacteria bacterium]
MTDPVLRIENLTVEIRTRTGVAPVIDDLSFRVDTGRTLALVGESGCGKSMTALAIMGLLPRGIGRIVRGSILLGAEDLATTSPARMRSIRGNEIGMIFQEPMTSLNPVYSVGEQISEVLRAHQGMGRKAAWSMAIELLDAVHIPNPSLRVSDYPFQMSGGQRQRVMIAIALACRPRVLIADEPTTALDVTVQAQIFDLLKDLQRDTGTAIILITHDMGAVTEMADEMIVMYAGRMAEAGPVEAVISRPRHPYTRGLISCVPHLGAIVDDDRPLLTEIPGIVPGLGQFGQDRCLFASRCELSDSHCRSARPAAYAITDGHSAACWQAGGAA